MYPILRIGMLVLVAATVAISQESISGQGYRIQPGDQLDVKLYYNSDLNEQITVRPDGLISLQLVGDVKVSGLTPAQASEQLRTAYARQLREPEVAVLVRSFAAQRVYVDGEISRPGVVDIPGQITLLQALTAAGGVKRTGRLSDVMIIRKTPDSGRQVITADLRNSRGLANPESDPVLQPLDVVIVPRTKISNINSWVEQYIKNNLPATFGIFASPF